MAISVTKLSGEHIPAHLRRPNLTELFAVTDDDGTVYHLEDDVEAARLAVQLSDEARQDESAQKDE